jgi:ABC-type sugar transport system ATPase subunit
MANLVLKNVSKSYGDTSVIHGVDLDVRDGEFVVFVGPSGCGKSTLLRMIAGLEGISGGEVAIGGEVVNDIAPSDRGIAMVFQSYALYPHKDVYGNMAFALRHAGEDKKLIDERVQRAAAILGLEQLLHRKPKELSGGQRQRVAIGRAIVRDPAIFLFDEPLSNLDAALRVQMRVEILRLHQRLKTTMIYVTHDQVEAMTLADRIVVLKAGRIEQVGTPLELYHHPRNHFVAGFIGSPKMNFLPARVVGWDEAGAQVSVEGSPAIAVPVEGAAAAGGEATLGVRPEHVRVVAAEGARVKGEVLVVERLGGETFLHIDLGGRDAFVVKADGAVMERQGSVVGLDFPAEALHLFDASGTAHPHRRRNALLEREMEKAIA